MWHWGKIDAEDARVRPTESYVMAASTTATGKGMYEVRTYVSIMSVYCRDVTLTLLSIHLRCLASQAEPTTESRFPGATRQS